MKLNNVVSLNLPDLDIVMLLKSLIKDYAISVLHEPEKEVISCSLSKAIQRCLSEVKSSQSADVVRILGNDHNSLRTQIR